MILSETPHIELHNIDCNQFMKDIPEKFYDLAIVDPPYGIGVNVNMGRRKGDKKSSYHKFFGYDLEIPNKEYFEELFRISENQIIWGGNYMTEYLRPSSCWLLWDKGFSEDVTFAQFEMAWTSFKSTCKKYDYNAAANKNRIHPTEKPIQLYKWLLKNYAKQGDKIFDTHCGSGSILIACKEMGFDITACELDKEYFEASVKRFNLVTSQLKLF